MDALGPPSLTGGVTRLILLSLLLLGPSGLRAQTQREGVTPARARELYKQGRWQALLDQIPNSPNLPADLLFYRGMASARLGRLHAARRLLLSGQRRFPKDKRFPVELAGIAFLQKNYRVARSELRRALHVDPQDHYANEFLGTIYFLQHNLDGALKYWNRAGEPKIGQVHTSPSLRIDPELLDRAFVFSPASVLELSALQLSRARLTQLGIFPRFRFDLVPAAPQETGAAYDLDFRAAERDGLGSGRLEGLLGLVSGVPYDTLYPDFYDLEHRAINLTSLVRWDPQKRRLHVALSAPLDGNPAWRARAYADVRDENWNLATTLHQHGPALTDLKLRRWSVGADLHSIIDARWSWGTGVSLERRTFGNFGLSNLSHNAAFTSSFSLQYRLDMNTVLLDWPGRRLRLNSRAAVQLGKMFTSPSHLYARAEASLGAVWFPHAQGKDDEITETVHVGGISGTAPLDELFILGLERDNNLPLRAHIGTRNGMKGSAPLGRDYFLSNWEIRRNVYRSPWFQVKLGPFLDTGRITGESGLFGSQHWLWDTGAEGRLRVLTGLHVILTYGKDLRTGRNTFYATVLR